MRKLFIDQAEIGKQYVIPENGFEFELRDVEDNPKENDEDGTVTFITTDRGYTYTVPENTEIKRVFDEPTRCTALEEGLRF